MENTINIYCDESCHLPADGTVKTYLWLQDADFVVIMKKFRDGTRLLITSFFVDQDYTRRDFQAKYENRISSLKTERPAQTAGPSPSALTPARDG
jgi:hypothetical protein